MTLALIWGTRPESLKIGPIAAELRRRGVPFINIATGQHTSLLSGTPAESDLANAVSLDLPSNGKVWGWVFVATKRLVSELPRLGVTRVVVQGDTMSALAGARAAHYLGLPVHHVEAGIRSGRDKEPWPEERIRVDIATLADWHYAPTELAAHHLSGEGIARDRILVTGNPVVSALARYAPEVGHVVEPGNHLVVTMHRRESREIGAIRDAASAALEWAASHPEADVLWPAHPGSGIPKIQTTNFRVMDPLPYTEMVSLVARAVGVATDSGGLQEECATLGVPCAVLRNVTDRPESLHEGLACMYSPGGSGMVKALDGLWTRQIARQPSTCYGTVESAANIASHLALLANSGA